MAAKREVQAAWDAEAKQHAHRTANTVWNSRNTRPADAAFPYLQNKGIADPTVLSHVRINTYNGKEQLVIPMYDRPNHIINRQAIDAEGGKFFLPGGEVGGAYGKIAAPNGDWTGGVYLAEGFATAASIHMATGKPVVIAFNAGNLPKVAEKMAAMLPENTLIYIAADNDASQTGIKKATEAAQILGERAKVVMPEFDEGDIARFKETHGQDSLPSDFNDLHELQGLEAVKTALSTPLSPDRLPETEIRLGSVFTLNGTMGRNALVIGRKSDPDTGRTEYAYLKYDALSPETVSVRKIFGNPQTIGDWRDNSSAVRYYQAPHYGEAYFREHWGGEIGKLQSAGFETVSLHGLKNIFDGKEIETPSPQSDMRLDPAELNQIRETELAKIQNGKIRTAVRQELARRDGLGQPETTNPQYQTQQENNMAQQSITPEQIQKHAQTIANIGDADYRDAALNEFAEQHGISIQSHVSQILDARQAELVGQYARDNPYAPYAVYDTEARKPLLKTHEMPPEKQSEPDPTAAEQAAVTVSDSPEPQAAAEQAADTQPESAAETAPDEENGIEFDGEAQDLEQEAPEAGPIFRQPENPAPERETITAEEVRQNLARARAAEAMQQPDRQKQLETVPPQQEARPQGTPEADLGSLFDEAAPQSERKPSLPGNPAVSQKPKPILDLNYATATGLEARYVRVGEKYMDLHDRKTVVFKDKGSVLKTGKSDAQTVSDMLDTAQAKNWGVIKISGSREFKQQMWLESQLRGIPSKGYKPNAYDIAKRDQLLEERQRNSIEAAQGMSKAPEERSEQLPVREKPVFGQPNGAEVSQNTAAAPDNGTQQLAEAGRLQTQADMPDEVRQAAQFKTEAVRNTQEMQAAAAPQTAAAVNPGLDSARALFQEKYAKLGDDAKARLAWNWQKVHEPYLKSLKAAGQDKWHDAALKAYYENTAKLMHGKSVKLEAVFTDASPAQLKNYEQTVLQQQRQQTQTQQQNEQVQKKGRKM